MAETFLEDVKLKIGTEAQFQEKLKDLPIGTLVGTTDPINKGDLSTDIINSLAKADNALPQPTNQTTGSAGQVLTKTVSGSEWQDAPSSGSTVVANPTTDATATLTKLSVDGATYSIPQATTGVEVVQATGTSTTAVMSQKATTDALSGKQAALSEAQLNAANSGVTAAKVSKYDGYESTINGKYTKPSAGIPKSDLAAAVQTSLGKADTALQEHQSLSNYVDKSSAQTIGGAKTFSAAITASGGVTSAGTITAKTLSTTDGTITSGSKTFTLPSATGTVALTSDIKIKSATLSGTTLTLTI